MMMILMYFVISHGGASVALPDGSLAQSPQGPSWVTGLCCDLSAACPDTTEGEDGVPPASGNGSQGGSRSGRRNPCCGLDSPASRSETQGHGVVCLNILCWVDGDLEHLICNLKVRENPSNTSRRVPISVLHLASELHLGNGTDGGTQSNCEGGEVITCFISLHSSSSLVYLTVNISNGTNSVRSPAMRVDPKDFMRLDPPVNLQYNVTAEGVVRLSWTVPPHSLRLLCCDVRYSPKPSAPSWEHIRGLRTAEAALSDLGAGLNYTAQVRCRRPGQPSLKSVWSRPLYIYLHEVSYVPERLFANAGSNVTIYCIFNNRSLSASNVVWWLNYHQKVPESQYSAINEYTSSVTLLNVKPPQQRGYDVLLCCQRQGEKSLCSYPYAQIYVKDIDMGISCETNGELASMTCRWNASQWAEVRFLYRRYDLPCDTLKRETGGASPAEECPVEGRGSRRCTLRPLLLASCYRMWLEVRKEEGAIQSRPVYVTPMELVKPHPPFDLDAVTVPDGFLSIRWKRHELPVYELQYELRYAAGKVDAQWKVHGSVFNLSAVIGVSEPCAVYTVQVRCKRFKGAGFWSDWSNPYNTTVHNFRAPESGPDFWRVIKENPKSNQTNVTLLLKPLPREKLFCCVEGLVIHHQTSGGAKWTEKFDYGSSYTFPWTEDVHRITVLAINSIGSSTRNSNMTLNRLFKSPSVQSFSSTMINSSCVALSWTLIANSSSPVSFVIEWRSQSRGGGPEDDGERVEWVRVPPMDRVFYLHDTFFASEEYQFILYPIFLNGEGEPVYSKDDRGRSRDEHAAYVLLMIVAFLSVVLFVSLTISQDQMRKVVWKDVPNPNNCSWARGVDFKKAETIENLFQHPERQTSCPLLLELEIISEAVVMEKTGPLGPDKEREAATLSPHSDSEKILELEASTFPISPDCSGQSGIIYATVLLPGESDLHYKQQESLSNSSDEGNFSANISDISESFPGGLWELENPPGFEPDPHRFCFYNSAEEFSETSELEDEGQDRAGTGKDLYYLGVASREEDEKEELEVRIRKEGVPEPACMERELLPLESNPLLRCLDSRFSRTDAEARGTPLYMPQFLIASSEPHRTRAHESRLQSSPL